MCQSHVEIKGYSVKYFDRTVTFKVPYHLTFIKGGAHTYMYALCRLMSYSYIYEASMSPALSGSSAIRRFKGNDAIEIRDEITFGFYTGLSHTFG